MASFPLFHTDADGNPMKYAVPVIFNRPNANWSASVDNASVLKVSVDTSQGDTSGQVMLVMEPQSAGSAVVTVTDSSGGNPPLTESFDVRDENVTTPLSGLDLAGASASGEVPTPSAP